MDKEKFTRRAFLLTATSASVSALTGHAAPSVATETKSSGLEAKHAEIEVQSQAQAIRANMLIPMSDEETALRLADILNSHHADRLNTI